MRNAWFIVTWFPSKRVIKYRGSCTHLVFLYPCVTQFTRIERLRGRFSLVSGSCPLQSEASFGLTLITAADPRSYDPTITNYRVAFPTPLVFVEAYICSNETQVLILLYNVLLVTNPVPFVISASNKISKLITVLARTYANFFLIIIILK